MVQRVSRGFTIAEVLFVVSLLALLLALGIANMGYSQRKSESKALAQVLAEELKAARQHAVTSGTPVGIGIPSDAGSKSHSQAIYLLEGDVKPRLTRVVNFANEFPKSDVFVGEWNINTWFLRDSSADNTVTQPAVNGGFDVTAWQAPFPQDHILVFTPAGTVVTNGLVNFDGDFHLVVAQGVEYTGDPALLAKAGFPQTITVTADGAIQAGTGLFAGTTQAVEGYVQSSPPATPPVLAATSNDAPVFIDIKRFPDADPSTLPPGVDVMVDEDGFATLEVSADDSNGDQLYCRWETDSGVLSKEGWTRMEWDRAQSRWISVWNWKPDPLASPGTVATLSCTVKDQRNEVAATIAAATKKIVKTNEGRIAFSAKLDGDNEIYIMNGDGSGLTQLTFNDGPDLDPHLSPDGSMITWVDHRSFDAGVTGKIMLMNSDGTDVHELVTDPATFAGDRRYPKFSPDGTEIVWILDEGSYSHSHVLITPVNNTGTSFAGWHFGDGTTPVAKYPTWSPDGSKIYLAWNDTRTTEPEKIGYYETTERVPLSSMSGPTPHGVPSITAVPGTPVEAPSISKNGDLVYLSGSGLSARIMKSQVNTTNWEPIAGTPQQIYSGQVTAPSFSFDQTKIIFGLGDQLHTVDTNGNDLKTITLFGATSPSWSE